MAARNFRGGAHEKEDECMKRSCEVIIKFEEGETRRYTFFQPGKGSLKKGMIAVLKFKHPDVEEFAELSYEEPVK